MDLLVENSNQFCLELLQNIQSDPHENTLISSFSVLIAMLMTLAGARNDTRNELIDSLKLRNFISKYNLNEQESLTPLHESIRQLVEKITGKKDENNTILVANKLVINNQHIDDSFSEIIRSYYDSQIARIDSAESLKSTIDETNKWARDLTNGKIDNLLDESFKSTSLALINLIYFNYEWKAQFDESKTTKEKFYLDQNHEKFVLLDTMKIANKFFPYVYAESLKAHIVSLPYKNESFLFNIVLPANEEDILVDEDELSLINQLKYETLKEEMKRQEPHKVDIQLPKFSIKKQIQLNAILKKIGIKKSFDSLLADFSGISSLDKLYLQEVFQTVLLVVNEKGTEAAAATVVKMMKRSIVQTYEIYLNRPFIYFISEKSTGLILFSGCFRGEDSSQINEDKHIIRESSSSKTEKTEL